VKHKLISAHSQALSGYLYTSCKIEKTRQILSEEKLKTRRNLTGSQDRGLKPEARSDANVREMSPKFHYNRPYA
jgi:hypothetical protein